MACHEKALSCIFEFMHRHGFCSEDSLKYHKLLNAFLYLKEGKAPDICIKRKAVLSDACVKISHRFADAGIRHAFLKGVICDDELYGGLGLKPSRDIDILLDSENIGKAKELLGSLGYIKGFYSIVRNGFHYHTRSEEINKELYSHETVQFSSQNNKDPINYYEVDLNFLFSWPGFNVDKTKLILLTKNALQETQVHELADGNKIPSLSGKWNMLNAFAHNFNESCYFLLNYKYWKLKPKDIVLARCYEAYCYYQSNKQEFNQNLTNELETAADFNLSLMDQIGLPLQQQNQEHNADVINQFYSPKGALCYWQSPLEIRLKSNFDRRAEVDGILETLGESDRGSNT